MPDRLDLPSADSSTSPSHSHGSELEECKHHNVCGRTEREAGLGYCILHDPDLDKDERLFWAVFHDHRARMRWHRSSVRRELGYDYEPRWALREDFRHVVFPSDADFRSASFAEEGVDFCGAFFDGDADFYNTSFDGDARFREVSFDGGAIFQEATFGGAARFLGTTFGGDANFWDTSFDEDASFCGASFGEEAGFVRARFSRYADYRLARFSGDARFWNATFDGDARFREVSLDGGAIFQEATFGGDTGFYNVTFGGDARFDSASFDGKAHWISEGEQRIFTNENGNAQVVHFRNAKFESPGDVVFRNANLRQATFLNVNVREFEFTNTLWPVVGSSRGVYDELEMRREGASLRLGELESLYRLLKRNYEEQRDHGPGGDFHFREKEMKRLNPDTPLQTRFLLHLYRRFSGYGERMWAGGWLLCLMLLSSVLTLGAGLKYCPEDGFLKGGCHDLGWGYEDVFLSLLYGMQTALLRPPAYLGATTPWGEVVKMGTMVLGPVLLALFALAVRQRLKR